MVLYAFDAASLIDLASVKSNGGIAVNAYVSGMFAVPKGYAQTVQKAGLGSWPNHEIGLWDLVSNRAAGQNVGRVSIANAIRAGYPANNTIWFPHSVDVNCPPDRFPDVAASFLGVQDFNAGRFKISLYGEGQLANYLRTKNIISEKCWLSSSYGFPGYDRNSADVCIYQLIGDGWEPFHERHPTIGSTDTNIITDISALHALWPTGSTYIGSDEFMSMTPAERTALLKDIAKEVWETSVQRVDPVTQAPNSRFHTMREWLTGISLQLAAAADASKEVPVDVAALAAGLAPLLNAASIDASAVAAELSKHLSINVTHV